MGTFSISLSAQALQNPETKAAIQVVTDVAAQAWVDEHDKLVKELGLSEKCVSDILYLRTRSRWSQELENDLIRRHKAGEEINIFEFGSTSETQHDLMSQIDKYIKGRKDAS